MTKLTLPLLPKHFEETESLNQCSLQSSLPDNSKLINEVLVLEQESFHLLENLPLVSPSKKSIEFIRLHAMRNEDSL